MLDLVAQGDAATLTYPGIHVYLLEVVSIPQVLYHGYDVFHGGKKAILCLLCPGERRVPREMVINFGRCHQGYNVGALNGNTSPEILEADIARE